MAITVKSRAGPLLQIAFVSMALLTRLAGAQGYTGGLNQPLSTFGDVGAAATERVQPYTYGIDAGVGETDNVTLAPSNKISQTIATVDADFTVNERSRLFAVNAKGDFSDLNYLQHAYGNELLGRFDGMADAAIVPGRLVWVLRDNFGQAALDPYTPVTPNNIENVNYLTTGPDLKLRFGAIDFADVSVRYARAQYQTSPFNSNRLIGNVSVGRDVSAGGSISLNADTERVMFDNTEINSNFERSSGFGRFEVHGARTDFIGDLGVTVVDQSGLSKYLSPVSTASTTGTDSAPGLPVAAGQTGGSGSSTGPLAKIELKRKLSASATLIFRAGRDLTDGSSSFSAQTIGTPGIGSVTPASLTSDTYRVTNASVGWQYQRHRTTLTVTGRWEKDIYPGLLNLDNTISGAGFSLDRKLTRTFSLQLLGNWYKTNYPHAALASQVSGSTEYANSILGASLTWRHGRGLEIRLRGDHDSYGVSDGNTGYHESRVFLTIGYRPTTMPASGELPES